MVVSARRDAQRTPPGQPHDPALFRNRVLLMKRLDRLSGTEMATLGRIFDAHPEPGVVWGLVQRFHVIFCAPTEELANQAVGDLADAYIAAGVNLGPTITSFCRWGPETLNFHGQRATNAASEGVNNKIEVLECMAYGFRSRPNLRRPGPSRLLGASTGPIALIWHLASTPKTSFDGSDHRL